VLQRNKLVIGAAVALAVLVLAYFVAGGQDPSAPGDGASEDGQPALVTDKGALENDNPLGEIVLGNPNAPVTIVEYASLTCGHCGNFHRTTLPVLKEKYVDTGLVQFKFRPFPFDEVAMIGAMLAQCVAPKQRVAFLDILFARQNQWLSSPNPIDEFQGIAQQAGLSEADFVVCRKDEKIFNGIRNMQKQANEELGVSSTPTFFVNGQKLEGHHPVESFDEVILPLLPEDALN